MAALVVLNSDLSKLTKTAIKKEIRKKLSTITLYKNFTTYARVYFSFE